jgi:ParB family transcriptional regulator, chromosome partitioning protein
MSRKTGLGQGVGLLFAEEKEKYLECEISKIFPNKHQPRSEFNNSDLEELAQSIKEKGVIQPLIVTFNTEEKRYELVAGERRLRASKLAGLTHVPTILMDVTDENSFLELALIENIQRTDLNPIEEASAYRKLIENFGYTQEETATRVGKQRSTITNLLRLLKLPDSIQKDISTGVLSEGHGRALIRLSEEPIKLLEARDLIVKDGLTVRQAEKLIRKLSTNGNSSKKVRETNTPEIPKAYGSSLVIQLTNYLNTKVTLNQNGNRGKIEIEYYSADDLERVFSILLGERQN